MPLSTKRTMTRYAALLCVALSVVCQGRSPVDTEDDPSGAFATGDLAVSNIAVGEADAGAHFRMVTFDIRWSHSWRTSDPPGNWDAAWIFLKYRVGSGDWRHATLSTVPAEHAAPAGATLSTAPDGKGVFLHRSEDGSGAFRAEGVSVRWNHGTDQVADGADVSVKVLGIEMVFIPEGEFLAGDQGRSYASLTRGSGDDRPWPISSEDAIEVTGAVSDGFYYRSSKDFGVTVWNAAEDVTGASFTLPAEFPKGHRAVYAMKYETTEQEYVDFLNTLTAAQAANRYDRANDGRFGYSISESGGVYSTRHPRRACGFLSPADGFAFADWAGLRPMSELEFEKISRGSGNPALPGEFAWGTTHVRNAESVTGSESDRGRVTSSGANSYYSQEGYQPQFALNAGIFFDVGKSREQSGATYYGILDMSGNLNETCVTVGNAQGRSFTSRNGDGRPSADGFADETGWPLRDGRGAGFRGGTLAEEWDALRLSDRQEAAVQIDWSHRHIPWGFRGVRTIR
jgi:hypothetical protein